MHTDEHGHDELVEGEEERRREGERVAPVLNNLDTPTWQVGNNLVP